MDPMMAMMLAQGLQGFADNLGAARRGVAPPQQGGAQEMIPMMSMMQRNQMAQQQMAEKQRQAQEQQKLLQDAVPGISEKTGLPPEVVMASLMGGQGDNPLFKAIGNNAENYSLGNVRYSGTDNAPIARSYEKSEFGSFDQLNGQHTVDPAVLAAKAAAARAGSTRVSVDARNMSNGFDAMLSTAQDERKSMSSNVSLLQEQAASAKEMADIAMAHPEMFGPGADTEALMKRGEALFKRFTTGDSLSPQETEALAAYERAKKLNLDEGIRTAGKLAPVSEAELKIALESALGPGTTVPRVVVQSLQLQAALNRAKAEMDAMDAYQANALEAARKGGPAYSPAAQRLYQQQWQKENPFTVDSYTKELKTLSEKFPLGGKSSAKPDPAGIR